MTVVFVTVVEFTLIVAEQQIEELDEIEDDEKDEDELLEEELIELDDDEELLFPRGAQSITAVYCALDSKVTYLQNCVLPVSAHWSK